MSYTTIVDTPKEITSNENSPDWWRGIEAQCSELQNIEYRKLCLLRVYEWDRGKSEILPDKEYSLSYRASVDRQIFFIDRGMTRRMELNLLASLDASGHPEFWTLDLGKIPVLSAKLNKDAPKGFQYQCMSNEDISFKEKFLFDTIDEAIRKVVQMEKEKGRPLK